HCFVSPVAIQGRRELAVIGGRAFVRSSDYQSLIERIRTGDLQALNSSELFANLIISERQRLKDAADLVERTARRFNPVSEPPVKTDLEAEVLTEKQTAPTTTRVEQNHILEKEVERLRSELEHKTRFADSLQRFLERISSNDPVQTYQSIISNSKDLLHSE